MQSSKKKILEEVLPLRLIRAVEKWPVLYMKDCPERNNAHFKNKVWQEVAKGLIENWDSLPQSEKEFKAAELSRKWRNLRDTFKRQLAVERGRRQGHRTKRKEYVYFKHMAFLLPHMVVNADEAPARGPRRPAAAPCPAPCPASAPRHLDIDEDEHFLMSLLPSFKRMSDDDKLTAKMEILKVIREVRSLSAAAPRSAGLAPLLVVSDALGEHELAVSVVKDELLTATGVDDDADADVEELSDRSEENDDSEKRAPGGNIRHETLLNVQ